MTTQALTAASFEQTVFSQPGALPASALEQVIASVRALDMDDIRSQIAEYQADAASTAATAAS